MAFLLFRYVAYFKDMANFKCSKCSTLMEIAPEHFGQQLQCPSCSFQFVIRPKNTPAPEATIPVVQGTFVQADSRPVASAPVSSPNRHPTSVSRVAGNFPKLPQARTERWYVHRACGETTGVTNPELKYMCNPLMFMTGTYCSECDGMFPVSEYIWRDTNEPMQSYYDRLLSAVPDSIRMIAKMQRAILLTSPVLGVVLGCLLGFLTGWIIGLIAAIVLAVIFFLVIHFSQDFWVVKILVPKYFGVDDATKLI